MHVLVCDDDNATRFAVKRMLTQHFPCTISECADGVQALQLIGREKFAFILLDVEMPAMSGIEVLELLRESPATKDLPVIVLSNVRDDRVVRHLLKLGVSDYVLKPARAEKLRVLERIEATTARQLRPLAEAAGVEVDGADDENARAGGQTMGSGDLGWDDFVKGLHDALPAFLASFVRLRTLAAEPGDRALVALITHEQAINAFAELELAGHADRSRSVLDWYLETAV